MRAALPPPQVRRIADLELAKTAERMRGVGVVGLEVGPALMDRILGEGYNEAMGARELRRAVTRLVDDALSDAVLRGEVRRRRLGPTGSGQGGVAAARRIGQPCCLGQVWPPTLALPPPPPPHIRSYAPVTPPTWTATPRGAPHCWPTAARPTTLSTPRSRIPRWRRDRPTCRRPAHARAASQAGTTVSQGGFTCAATAQLSGRTM
jgi:hypothetical protein